MSHKRSLADFDFGTVLLPQQSWQRFCQFTFQERERRSACAPFFYSHRNSDGQSAKVISRKESRERALSAISPQRMCPSTAAVAPFGQASHVRPCAHQIMRRAAHVKRLGQPRSQLLVSAHSDAHLQPRGLVERVPPVGVGEEGVGGCEHPKCWGCSRIWLLLLAI
jgi:hypothetical protein